MKLKHLRASYVAIDEHVLNKSPWVKAGEEVACPDCDKKHVLVPGTKDGELNDTLLFYKCGNTSYVAAIEHRLLLALS